MKTVFMALLFPFIISLFAYSFNEIQKNEKCYFFIFQLSINLLIIKDELDEGGSLKYKKNDI